MKEVSLGFFGGREIKEYRLTSENLKISFLNCGAAIRSLITPDAEGREDDIVLGYDSIEKYLENADSFGCLTGRYANRIGGAAFELNGRRCLVSANEGENCLHGGIKRLSHKFFELEEFTENMIRLGCDSPDGESGFPGHLKVSVEYKINGRQLDISYQAISDTDTVINLTNHSYFNLGGHNSGSILEHEILVNADSYLPVDDEMLPLDPAFVLESPFDIREKKSFGGLLGVENSQLQKCGGFDHCFILNNEKIAARVEHPYTGRVIECETDQPGLQLYTANHIDGIDGKDGAYYGKYPAFCLETQHFPDSPNRPEFPSVVLRGGEVFESKTTYRFGTLNDL